MDFSITTIPMTRLTCKEAKFVWGYKCEQTFQSLNEELTIAPMLTLFDGSEGFVIYSDVSKLRLDCVLMQHGKVVAYASRQLKVSRIMPLMI